ncbi:hypothetical protein PG997_000014 [Apiospora hydei]|uniref:Uncharacterized protein n=1 Tax=Apiospora hydei TaxID=1337664 RepID=A0ABR1X9M4_9PEZI
MKLYAVTVGICFGAFIMINLPFITITIAAILLFFKPPQRGNANLLSRLRSLDVVGSAIFIPGIFMLLLVLQRGGQQDPWNSATVIGLLTGSGVMLLRFVAWEVRQGDGALIPGAVVARRSVIFSVLFGFFHMGSLTIASYYLPEWFQVVQGVDPLQSGIRMLPTVLSQLLTIMFASGVAIRIGYYNPWFFLAATFMCTSNALYTQFDAVSTPASHCIGYQVIQGIGAGFGMQMTSLSVQLELKDSPDLVPVGIAFVMFLQYLGSTFTQVAAGAIFNSELQTGLVERAGLSPAQAAMLLAGGTRSVRDIANEHFPDHLSRVLEGYNSAITKVFFIPVACTAAAFFLALGIKWNKIEEVGEGPLSRLRNKRRTEA